MMALDADKFPTVAAYLATLPDGLDSYPHCQSKAALYRTLALEHPLSDQDRAGLPESLRRLVDAPKTVAAWIPEVHSHALMLAVYDRSFDSLAHFEHHTFSVQRQLFESKIYAFLMRAATPQLLFRGVSLRWKAFHKGSKLVAESFGECTAVVRLEQPPGVWDEVTAVALGAGLRAAADLLDVKNVQVDIVVRQPEVIRYCGRWFE